MKMAIKYNKQLDKNKGFTLIELLASMIVILVTGSIIGSIFISSLRVTNKTNTINSVRQNGYFAIIQISKMLRDAKRIEGVSINGSPPFSETCEVAGVEPLTPTPVPIEYKAIMVQLFNGEITTFACEDDPKKTISINGASLLDVTTVATSTCYFTCSQKSLTDYITIGINFSLTEYKPVGAVLFPEFTASIPFETAVVVRNISR